MIATLKDEFKRLVEILGLELEEFNQGEDFVKAEWTVPISFSDLYTRLFDSKFYTGSFVLVPDGSFSIFVKNLPVSGKSIRVSLDFRIFQASKGAAVKVEGRIFSYEYASDTGEILVFMKLNELKDYLQRRKEQRKFEKELVGLTNSKVDLP